MINSITHCRLCLSDRIPIVWDFGISPMANAFKTSAELELSELELPLRYFKCDNCHSIQLKDEVDPNILFKEYLYETPPNLIPHFKELVKTTVEYLNIQPFERIVDIGSNNGLLLQEFKNLGYTKVAGFEPCDRIAQKARDKDILTISKFFNSATAETFTEEHRRPELITCTNCFAHVPNLTEFIDGLKIIMSDTSYFVFENAYLLNTIQNKDFGQAYFEHMFMHSILPLEKFFSTHGFELFKVEYNNVQMGSIRGYVRRNTNRRIQKDSSVADAINKELSVGLDKSEIYSNFINDINDIKTKLISKLEAIKADGKSTVVYAWPAKMTLLNKYFGVEKYLNYIIEESNVKTGKYAPGTHLEIKDLQYFKENPTDYCLLGAYNFETDIRNKNSWYLGQWINPLNL